MAGAGSVWNTGNWHWEEKNYKQWGNSRLSEMLRNLTIENEGYTITIPEVSKITGEASVNIRKGKTILFFEFEIETTWRAVKENTEHTGKLKIPEFNQEEMEDFELEPTCDKEDEASRKVKYFLQTRGKKEFSKVFQQFFREFKELESNQEKIELDKQRRVEEEEKRKIALAEKTQEHERILKAAKEKEENDRKIAESTRDEGTIKGQGSVWNANSYFWEEKSVFWAKDRLKELLDGKKILVPEGEISLNVEEVLGDSSVSIRKGKKIYTYCHEIKLKWTGRIGEAQNSGNIFLPDVSEDSTYDMVVSCNETIGQDLFRDLIGRQVKKEIVESIGVFVNQLKEF